MTEEFQAERPRFITNIGLLAVPVWVEHGLPDKPVKLIHNTWLELNDGRIIDIGDNDQPSPDISDDIQIFDAMGMLVTPGFVDCHTHPVFAGTRQNEFVKRCQGATYQEIAAEGGGILSSVRGVRNYSQDDLTALVLNRFDEFLLSGTTSIEGKSGYGLSKEEELKSLRVIDKAANDHALEVSPTLLAAHVVPPEYIRSPDEYVDIICNEIIPEAADKKLAYAVDVFLEEGAYNIDQARRIFTAGKRLNLQLRIHADQFSMGGGAQLAAEFGALTADHMDRTDDTGMQSLANSNVTVTLLPGAVFFLGLEHYADARRMIDKGCRIALSTDFNPGSTPTQSIPLMMTLACIKMQMTPDEALWAATLGGAFGIGRSRDVGTIERGFFADLCLWDAEDVDYLPYRYGNMMPAAVFKKGKVVAFDGRIIDSVQ